MKKHIFSLALVAAMIGAMATGCSSANKTGDSDTTVVKDTTKVIDSTKVIDTTKVDTTQKDSVK